MELTLDFFNSLFAKNHKFHSFSLWLRWFDVRDTSSLRKSTIREKGR
jgi:hypothetical protein